MEQQKLTMCGLTNRDMELLIMMRWIDSHKIDGVSAWDLKCGRVIIDFDKDGKIGSFNISQNYRTNGFDAIQILA